MFLNYLLLGLFSISACLVFNSVANEVIIGGDAVEDHHISIPYQASLRISGFGVVCGGGIIADEFVLTAAHCVIKRDGDVRATPILVVVGTNNMHDLDIPALTVGVQQIYVPIQYNPRTAHSVADIAVLKLHSSLELSKNRHLKKLELPHMQDTNYAGEKAVIAGFGWNVYEQILHKTYGVNKDGQLRFAVADVLREGDEGYQYEKVEGRHICARIEQRNSSERRGVCRNDSGGPLVRNETTVIGILSIAPTVCSERDYGGLYTPVSHYLKFIRHALNYQRNKYHWDIHMYQLKY